MSRRIKVQLNRVEGDLELELEINNGVVTDAWCIGTMYRGFEQILLGREPMDALAITPRVCGICSTAHLFASTLAIESASSITPPPNAIRVRNICLLAEEIQSDCRQTFLMFCPDLCHPSYNKHPLYPDIQEHFEEMKGKVYQEAVINSRSIIEIVAIFGGQWPHSSYMVPGGVTSLPDIAKVMSAISVTTNYLDWFENNILGMSQNKWSEIDSLDALNNALSGNKSAAGLLHKFCHDIGLTGIGGGSSLLMSYGSIINPDVPEERIRKPGLFESKLQQFETLNQQHITEDISYSWYYDEENQPRHPHDGLTQPKFSPDSDRYTWAKAPRYQGKVVQTGPLAQLVIDNDPLMLDCLVKQGCNSWLRQFARIQRQAKSILLLKQQLEELLSYIDEPTMVHMPITDGEGIGMIEAARGSLGHWLRVEDNKITGYQIITPTAWNASPRDKDKKSGHIEQSLIGLPITNPDDPIEIGHVVRSHDPCLVCTVHVIGSGKKHRYGVC